MTAFELGMCLNKIALSCDEQTLERIKPELNKLETGIVELFEELNNKEKNK